MEEAGATPGERPDRPAERSKTNRGGGETPPRAERAARCGCTGGTHPRGAGSTTPPTMWWSPRGRRGGPPTGGGPAQSPRDHGGTQQTQGGGGHSVIEIVTDDMPFLVDSVTAR